MSKFNCIILDPELSSRMRLKQATSQVGDFGVVNPVGTFHDANSILNGENRNIDVIFVSTRFETQAISDFVTQAKKNKFAEDAAFVMIMKTLPQGGSSSIAQNMMIGGDSVLCEPYSVDSLVEITRLAARIKKERSDARERIGVTLLIGDLIKQIDLIAYLRFSGCEPGTSIKALREMSALLKNLTPEMVNFYYETVITKFEEAKVPVRALSGKKYGGVSQRVKKKIENKIIADSAKIDKPIA